MGPTTTGTGETDSNSFSTPPNRIDTHRRGLVDGDRAVAEDAVKELARRQLTTATLAWGTLTQWVRATRQLARFLTRDDESPEPSAVTRPVFLTTWRGPGDRTPKRTRGWPIPPPTCWSRCTTPRSCPLSGRRCSSDEARTCTARPAAPARSLPDVIERVDTLIVDNPATDPTLRSMIATTRWAGCRISELVALPIDCSHRPTRATDRILMPKPGPGADSPSRTASQPSSRPADPRARHTYGPDAEHLFPGAWSNAAAGRTHPGRPAACGTASPHCSPNTASPPDHHRRADLRRRCAPLPAHHRKPHCSTTAGPNKKCATSLGHHSDTMTSAYARITDDTLALQAREFWNSAATDTTNTDADDGAAPGPVHHRAAQRILHSLNGATLRIPAQPCLDCSTTPAAGSSRRPYRAPRPTATLTADAHERGDAAAVELNTAMLDKVSKLISEIARTPHLISEMTRTPPPGNQ